MRPTEAAGARRLEVFHLVLSLLVRRPEGFNWHEQRGRVAAALLACLIFVAVVGIGWLLGTKPPSPPAKKPATATEESQKKKGPKRALVNDGNVTIIELRDPTSGRIVYELPDGLSCLYVPFDNVSQWMGEPVTAVCEDTARKQRRPTTTFSWGRGE